MIQNVPRVQAVRSADQQGLSSRRPVGLRSSVGAPALPAQDGLHLREN